MFDLGDFATEDWLRDFNLGAFNFDFDLQHLHTIKFK